jgi:myo-inositol 2-dehydrogenase/D-chiro-inositol 1-dehydrogenase
MSGTTGAAGPAVGIGIVGAGKMGRVHARSLAGLPDARLVAVADPAPGAAAELAGGGARAYRDPAELLADPAVDAVVIATPAARHADLVVATAAAGRAVFCEKPMARSVAEADRAVEAATAAGVPLQVGFNRRFAADFRAARAAVEDGRVGTPHLLRSLTRDPGGFDPATMPPWSAFRETLIHDFDALRWLNPGAEAVAVYAAADALVRPDWKDRGLVDTAVVTVRFDNGAIGTAETSFSAAYGYDVRAEVLGPGGMVTAGGPRAGRAAFYGDDGMAAATVRSDVDLFVDAYTAELAAFVHCVRNGERPYVTGDDARAALAIAAAAIRSVETGQPVRVG